MDFTCLPWLRLENQGLFHMHWMAGERVNSGCWGAAPSASSLSSRVCLSVSLSFSAPWSAFYQASISGLIYFHSYHIFESLLFVLTNLSPHLNDKEEAAGRGSSGKAQWEFFFSCPSATWSAGGFVRVSSDLFSSRWTGKPALLERDLPS